MRQGFLRKVLGLVTAQLLLTSLVAGFIGLSDGGKLALKNNPWILTVSAIASIAIILAVSGGRGPGAQQRLSPCLVVLILFVNGC